MPPSTVRLCQTVMVHILRREDRAYSSWEHGNNRQGHCNYADIILPTSSCSAGGCNHFPCLPYPEDPMLLLSLAVSSASANDFYWPIREITVLHQSRPAHCMDLAQQHPPSLRGPALASGHDEYDPAVDDDVGGCTRRFSCKWAIRVGETSAVMRAVVMELGAAGAFGRSTISGCGRCADAVTVSGLSPGAMAAETCPREMHG